MAPHSSTLAWKIPWTEEPGRLQSMGSLRVRHSRTISLSLFTFMHWRRKWQPTPVFLPGESQGRGSLVRCRLWGRTELDTTEVTQQQQQHGLLSVISFENFTLFSLNTTFASFPLSVCDIFLLYLLFTTVCVSSFNLSLHSSFCIIRSGLSAISLIFSPSVSEHLFNPSIEFFISVANFFHFKISTWFFLIVYSS